MNSQISNCDLQLLQQCLDDQLTSLQEERLDRHLSDCPTCRSRLHELAADQRSWERIRGVLKDQPSHGSDSELSPTVIQGQAATDFAVDFLEPANDDRAIGRLANIEIQSVIGRGGNGIVLKGFQPELNRPVAVKVMAPHLAVSASARQRFAREAQATAAVVHPNVMPILSVQSTGQLPYLVMPYVACESLQQRLDREGPLNPIDALRIAHQVANALAAAHAQGLVHRDVKPANILLEQTVDRVMLTDFGLARAVDDASLTRTGLIAGTPHFMSPEQARGDVVDVRSDLFSLGSVLYTMLAGRVPFRSETSYGILRRVTDEEPRPVGDVNSRLAPWLNQVVRLLMNKEREERAQSADEVSRLLEQCVAHLQNPNQVPLPDSVRGRNRLVRGLLFAAAMVVLVLIGLAAFTPQAPFGRFAATSLNDTAPDSAIGQTPESQQPEPAAAPEQLPESDNSEADSAASQAAGHSPAAADVQLEWSAELDRRINRLDLEINGLLREVEAGSQPSLSDREN